jgi:hypothetical protein
MVEFRGQVPVPGKFVQFMVGAPEGAVVIFGFA